jgi:hypothetical protein
MIINNLQAFDAAIRAVCPAIDGVAADGFIFFQPTATAAQVAAANAAAASYVDPPPPVSHDIAVLVSELARLGVLPPASVALIQKTVTPSNGRVAAYSPGTECAGVL